MVPEELVMACYCGVTFGLSAIAFGLRYLLLRDAARSRLSKAEEYVPPVEIIAWVLAWFGVSVSLVIANRWLFHDWQGVGFRFPVLTTMVHMWLKVILSRITLARQGRKPAHLDLSIHMRTIVPIGFTTAGDILLSNLSFIYSTVTFYTIVKSGSLMWILLWAVIFQFEAMSFKTFVVVLGICIGLLLASWGQTDFSVKGMLMILGASCLSGLRWALVQFLQASEASCADPLVTIFYIAPSSALAMTPMALFDVLRGNLDGVELTTTALVQVATVIIGAGFFSFALIYAEVKLLTISSSLTMGVFGTLKEVVQIAMAVMVFSDKVTLRKILGLTMAITFSMAYKMVRGKPRHNPQDSGGKNPNGQYGQGGGASKGDGNSRSSGPQLSYSAVSQQEVDEELRVFQYSTEMELEGELEEFSSYRGQGERLQP